jgi:hypothetical protein
MSAAPSTSSERSSFFTNRLWLVPLTVAIAVGVWLRLDQILAQVLIDDEWHAIHQLLLYTPSQMFLDFGYADYSIPLGILDWYEAQWFGLSELSMRLPMLIAGIAALVLFPTYVARRLSYATAAVFALLLAMSPLLIIYSRMARPYALTLLLGWIAHAAFQRYWRGSGGALGAGALYGTSATLAIWLHLIVAPFAFAPLVWGAFQIRRLAPDTRRAQWIKLAWLAVPTGLATSALIVPPYVASARWLALKSGLDLPNAGTITGVWYAWVGTPSTWVVIACGVFAAIGMVELWRRLPEARTGALGVLLTLLGVLITRPMFSYNPVTLARYLLPLVPLLLLAVSEGAVTISRLAFGPGIGRHALAILVVLVPGAALAWHSPLVPLLREPNSETLHLAFHFDFRPEHNPYFSRAADIPLSRYWERLGQLPADSARVAVAPAYFESFNWDAPRWEQLSHQRVVPAYLIGLCTGRRFGEVPDDIRFRFRNAVPLTDPASLAGHDIDYLIWQKPYLRSVDGHPRTVGIDTAHCEPTLRARFGPPSYEDERVIVFDVPRARPADAER